MQQQSLSAILMILGTGSLPRGIVTRHRKRLVTSRHPLAMELAQPKLQSYVSAPVETLDSRWMVPQQGTTSAGIPCRQRFGTGWHVSGHELEGTTATCFFRPPAHSCRPPGPNLAEAPRSQRTQQPARIHDSHLSASCTPPRHPSGRRRSILQLNFSHRSQYGHRLYCTFHWSLSLADSVLRHELREKTRAMMVDISQSTVQ